MLGYFQGIQKTFLPTNTAQNPAPAIEAPTLEEMRKQITTDTEAQRKKAMEEAEFQLYRYRNTFDSKPRTNKF